MTAGCGPDAAERVHLGLGSNLGDRVVNLRAALAGLAVLPRTRLIRASGLYRTRPVGGPADQGEFLNSGCLVETDLAPREFLSEIRRLERGLGRSPESAARWGPRLIDIDILLWGGLVMAEPDLTIPHPRLAERAFALLPLAELDPRALHPRAGATVAELLERIGSRNEVICRLPL